MKIKGLIGGMTLIGGLLTLAAPASADWHDRHEVAQARHEYRHDLYRDAGPREIARDRAAIARERREIWRDRRDWRYDHRRDDYYHWPWHRG